MKRSLRFAVAAALMLPVAASAEGFNISARASTLGVGFELGYALNDYVNLRVASNNYDDTYETTEDDIDYDFDLELKSTAFFVDIHPFGGTFRITGGMLDNKNRLDGRAVPNGTYEINGVDYDAADVGTLFSTVTVGEDRPMYLGLGWSKALGNSGFGFGFDIGAVMLGDSSVELTATGPITTMDPDFAANLEAEEDDVESDINEDFEMYPVIALGITYQF